MVISFIRPLFSKSSTVLVIDLAIEDLTKALLKTGSIRIAYETIEDRKGGLPLLAPMSEVAGRLATQQGAKYLERTFGGRGLFLGGVTGTPSASVLVIGDGVVGIHAAQVHYHFDIGLLVSGLQSGAL